MKVLIYSEYFLPVVGGVQTSVRLLARGLVDLNTREKLSDRESIHVTLATRTIANGFDDSSLPYRVVRRPGFGRLFQLVREADVIHLAGPCLLPMAMAWLIRKPVVIEHHAYQAICPNGLLFLQPSQTVCSGHFMERRYGACLRCCSGAMGWAGSVRSLILTFPRRWLCKRAAANITITNHVGKRLMLPRSRTLYYGIETASKPDNDCAVSESANLEVAYIGRLVAEKGLPLLLDAAKVLSTEGVAFHLTFIGDGPERTRLESMVDHLDLRKAVAFTGDLRDSGLERAVNKIAVVVMPSVWEETAGLSAIEHMMRGRLVVSADIGGLGEVVGNAGLKFAAGDSAMLASRLRQAAQNRQEITTLGSVARKRAETLFSVDRMVSEHSHLYRELSAADQSRAGYSKA
jgi:glycosyltransferase involved in cell wall biosynthesis